MSLSFIYGTGPHPSQNLPFHHAGHTALPAKQRLHPTQRDPRIHPTIAQLITGMTKPDRTRRSQDLYDVIAAQQPDRMVNEQIANGYRPVGQEPR
ncbi:MAG TPA: hypothetical protein VHE54_10680 [Puia sp.]|nr:hypothetical protein [Puia sp.]